MASFLWLQRKRAGWYMCLILWHQCLTSPSLSGLEALCMNRFILMMWTNWENSSALQRIRWQVKKVHHCTVHYSDLFWFGVFFHFYKSQYIFFVFVHYWCVISSFIFKKNKKIKDNFFGQNDVNRVSQILLFKSTFQESQGRWTHK